MLKNVLIIAAAAAVVAGVDASSLRSSILGQLSAQSSASALPGFCTGIVGNPNNQDRYCEHGTGRLDQCQCREQCHIRGDPHIEPFLTACDVRSLKQEGWYSFFESKESGSKSINVYGYSEPLKENGFWISKLYLNTPSVKNSLVLTVDMCDEAVRTGRTGVDLRNNKKKAKGKGTQFVHSKYVDEVEMDGHMVQVEVTAICTQTGSAPMHIDTNIEIIDDCQAERASPGENGEYELRGSVMMFPKSAGVCLNPCNNDVSFLGGKGKDKPSGSATRDLTFDEDGKVECGAYAENLIKKNSAACVKRDGAIDGKVCDFGAQCAVHGDPYLASFYMPHPSEGKRDKCIKNAVLADPDDTSFTNNNGAVKARDAYVKSVYPVRSSGVERECIEIFPKKAEASQTLKEQQQSVQSQELYFVPSQVQVLALTNECQLITSVTVSFGKKGDSATYVAEDLCPTGNLEAGSTNVLIPVPSAADQSKYYDSSVGGFKLTGSEFESGAIQVNLKCHITKKYDSQDGSEKRQRPYFNVCIERKAAKFEQKADETFSGDYFQIESDLRSRGWCQTGLIAIKGTNEQKALFDWEEIIQEDTIEYSEQCLLGTKKCL